MAHGVAVTRASRVRRRTLSLSPDSPSPYLERLWQRKKEQKNLARGSLPVISVGSAATEPSLQLLYPQTPENIR